MLDAHRFITGEKSIFINPRPENGVLTPYSSVARNWYFLRPYCIQQRSPKYFKMLKNGHQMEIYDGHATPQILDMRLVSQTFSTFNSQFLDAVKDLLPSSTTLDAFSTTSIRDDNVSDGPHAQRQNHSVIASIQTQLRKEYMMDTSRRLFSKDIKALKDWRRLDQRVLALLAVIFTLYCGFPFRSWQFSGLKFHSTDGSYRNVWILSDGRVIIANPQAKQRWRKVYQTLLAFPQQIAAALIFYLFIIRPLACEAFDGLSGYNLSAYRYEIWARATARKGRLVDPYRWTGNDVSRSVGEITRKALTVRLTPFSMRQIAQAFLHEKFPLLFEHGLSPKKAMVPPNVSAELHQYSKECCFHSRCMPPDNAVALLAISEIWQAALGIRPPNCAWEYLVEGSFLFPSRKYRTLAFFHARGLIDRTYGVGQDGLKTKSLVKSLLQQAPFLKGQVRDQIGYMPLEHPKYMIRIRMLQRHGTLLAIRCLNLWPGCFSLGRENPGWMRHLPCADCLLTTLPKLLCW